jgi:hypothetical protein
MLGVMVITRLWSSPSLDNNRQAGSRECSAGAVRNGLGSFSPRDDSGLGGGRAEQSEHGPTQHDGVDRMRHGGFGA